MWDPAQATRLGATGASYSRSQLKANRNAGRSSHYYKKLSKKK